MPLTDAMCRGIKLGSTRRKLSDGGGLQLWIMPNGSRLWRLVYRHLGKQKELAIGTYPEISLAEARQRRDEAKTHLRDGKDPTVEREKARRVELERAGAEDTFAKVADEFVAKCRRESFSEVTLIKKSWLLDMALPALGEMKVSEIGRWTS